MLLVIVSLTTLSQRWNNKQSPVTYLFNKIIFWQNISIKKQKERTKRHITKMFTGFNQYWPYWWTWHTNKSILLFVVAWKCIVVPHMNIYILKKILLQRTNWKLCTCQWSLLIFLFFYDKKDNGTQEKYPRTYWYHQYDYE